MEKCEKSAVGDPQFGKTANLDNNELNSSFCCFNGGTVDFAEGPVEIKGSIPLIFPHQIRKENPSVFEEMKEDMRIMLAKYIPWKIETVEKLITLMAQFSFYNLPIHFIYADDVENESERDAIWVSTREAARVTLRTKRFWYNVYGIAEWIADDFMDEEKFRNDPDFTKMMKSFSKFIYDILQGSYKTWGRAKEEVESTLLGRYPKPVVSLHLFYILFKGLKSVFGCSVKDVEEFACTCLEQYQHNCWLDWKGHSKIQNVTLFETRRVRTSGSQTHYAICMLLDGFNIPNSMQKDQHVRRYNYLMANLYGSANDLISLKKEVMNNEGFDNIVYIRSLCKETLGISKAVQKTIETHIEYCREAKEISTFLSSKYNEDAAEKKYLQILRTSFNSLFQFSREAERYGIEISIQMGPNECSKPEIDF